VEARRSGDGARRRATLAAQGQGNQAAHARHHDDDSSGGEDVGLCSDRLGSSDRGDDIDAATAAGHDHDDDDST
jgi:hypothetical protein